MTDQEAFDTVVRHLASQKQQSSRITGDGCPYCCYRSPYGLMCAIGVLIPDEQYSPAFEFEPVGSIQEFVPALKGLNTELLKDLQELHDATKYWDETGFIGWDEIRKIGDTFGLDVSVLGDTKSLT